MKRVKLVFWISMLISVLAFLPVVGYSQSLKITFLNSKGEIQTQLEEIATLYSELKPDIALEIIPCPVGQSPFEKIVSMYASGNAPTISMVDAGDVKKFQDRILTLTSEKWIEDAIAGSLDMATLSDGTVVGFPFAVEGYGLIYNKKVIDEAIGSFDPSSVRTRKDLETLFENIKASGVEPLVVSPLDWSLGAHFFTISYAAQSPDPKKVDEFLQNLRAAKVDLSENAVVNGLLDTFDVMKKYNIDRNDPLSGTYDRGVALIGTGEVGLWFMGNWAWPQISEFAADNLQFGFLPVPISNNPDDYGNSQIPVGATKFLIIDKNQNSKEAQEAAKDFLNWLVYDEIGQDMLVNKLNIIPAFKNVTLEPQDPLAKSILQYVREGKTMQFVLDLPPDHWSMVGASMQKYLADVVDREGLLDEIENYWKANVK